MGEYIYGKGYLALFTESWGNSDVLGIRNSGFAVEFEIKTTYADFRNELLTIQSVLKKEVSRKPKYIKHKEYLTNESYNQYYTNFYRPNLFYFVVPMELEEMGVQGVTGTPYGLMAYGDFSYTISTSYGEKEIKNHGFKETIKPKYIHRDKIKDDVVLSLIRKASTELYETRKALEEKNTP